MEKNNNHQNNVSKNFKIITIFLLLLFSLMSVNAVEELTRWQFEEGGGSIILDTSGNSRHGTVLGGRWQGGVDARWGNFGFDFDNNNDYIEMITSFPAVSEFSISFWVKPDRNDELDTLWALTDNINVSIHLEFDGVTNDWFLEYIDVNNTLQNVSLDNFEPVTSTTWYHLVISIDLLNESISYYRDGTLIIGTSFPVSPQRNPASVKTFDLGGHNGEYFDGDMDELRIFDIALNVSQVNELYTTNTVSLIPGTPIINETQPASIVVSQSPDNVTVQNDVQFDLVLNRQATCDFYLDNKLTYEFVDIVSVSFTETLEEGSHQYFYYCEYVENTTQYFEITNSSTFEVIIPETTATFTVIGDDFDVSLIDLYIASPCPVEGYSAIGVKVGYQAKYNTEGIYWQKLDSTGKATINTTIGDHEFCLFNGRVIYNEEGKTTNYNVQEFNGMLKLGNISIPNLVSNSYTIRTNRLEIFSFYKPEAHGTNATALIVPLLALVGGIFLITRGANQNNGRLAIAGVILALIGFGFSVGGLFGILL